MFSNGVILVDWFAVYFQAVFEAGEAMYILRFMQTIKINIVKY